jgi:hypothetical protein
LIRLGLRKIPFGIAALSLGFFLNTAVTQAGSAESGLVGSGLSVFGTNIPIFSGCARRWGQAT